MQMKHYLLTRFNIGLYKNKQKTRHNTVIDPNKWMADRIELFGKYCVPSVENQSTLEFSWLIVVDPATPMRHLLAIKGTLNGLGEIIIGTNFRQAIKSTIPNNDIVITSRLDCDDAIHCDYIQNIQNWWYKKKKTGVLTYPVGWIYNPHKKKLYHARYIKNPFLSLVEKADKKIRTILFHRHTEAVNYYKLHKLEKGHMWCQIIHKNNLANHCWGDQTNIAKLNKKDFWE